MHMKNIATLSITLAAVLAVGVMATGCVPKTTYDKNVVALADQLTKERQSYKYQIEALESKVAIQSKSLNEITNMYINLQREFKDTQKVFRNLRGDMEALLRDIEELKLVVMTNMKGSEADEMIFKLNAMENRVDNILKRSGDHPLN